MAVREGFKRIRAVLAVLSVLWMASMVWLAVDAEFRGLWLFLLFASIPVAVAWALLWVVEGFVVKAGDK